MGIRWQDGVPNEGVVRRSGVGGLEEVLHKIRLRWFGHVRRREEHILRQAVNFEVEGRRLPGRPKKTWRGSGGRYEDDELHGGNGFGQTPVEEVHIPSNPTIGNKWALNDDDDDLGIDLKNKLLICQRYNSIPLFTLQTKEAKLLLL